MKRLQKLGYIAIGFILSVAIMGTALAATGLTITVDPTIKIMVNGELFTPKDATGKEVMIFAYNGTTYAPLRAMAEAFGLEVGYDATTKMAAVGAKGTLPQTPVATPEPSVPPTPTNAITGYVFSMTDAEIQQAIENGKADLMTVQKSYLDKFIVPVSSKNIQTSGGAILFDLLAEKSQVTVLTPCVYITRMSCVSNANFKTYPFDAAKEYYTKAEKVQGISIEAMLAEISYNNSASFSVGVMQDGKVISVPAISGLDGFPDKSSAWPDTPAYERLVVLTLNQSSIDVNRPIQLIVRHATGDEIVYEINLTNY